MFKKTPIALAILMLSASISHAATFDSSSYQTGFYYHYVDRNNPEKNSSGFSSIKPNYGSIGNKELIDLSSNELSIVAYSKFFLAIL